MSPVPSHTPEYISPYQRTPQAADSDPLADFPTSTPTAPPRRKPKGAVLFPSSLSKQYIVKDHGGPISSFLEESDELPLPPLPLTPDAPQNLYDANGGVYSPHPDTDMTADDMHFLMPELAAERAEERLAVRHDITSFRHSNRQTHDLFFPDTLSHDEDSLDVDAEDYGESSGSLFHDSHDDLPSIDTTEEKNEVQAHLSHRASVMHRRKSGPSDIELEVLAALDATAEGGPTFNVVTDDPSHLFWVPASMMHDEMSPKDYDRYRTKFTRTSSLVDFPSLVLDPEIFSPFGDNLAQEESSLERKKSTLVPRRMTPDGTKRRALPEPKKTLPSVPSLQTTRPTLPPILTTTLSPQEEEHENKSPGLTRDGEIEIMTEDNAQKVKKKKKWRTFLKSPLAMKARPLPALASDEASSPTVLPKRPKSASLLDNVFDKIKSSTSSKVNRVNVSAVTEDMLILPGRLRPSIERHVFQLAHQKLAAPKRPLAQQVIISNLVFFYLRILRDEALQAKAAVETESQDDLMRKQKALRRRLGRSAERGGVNGTDKAINFKRSASEPVLAHRARSKSFTTLRPTSFAIEDAKARGLPRPEIIQQSSIKEENAAAARKEKRRTSAPTLPRSVVYAKSPTTTDMERLQASHRAKSHQPVKKLVDMVADRERQSTEPKQVSPAPPMRVTADGMVHADDDDEADEQPLFLLQTAPRSPGANTSNEMPMR